MKPFAKVDKPKLRYLSDDEARRLVAGSRLAPYLDEPTPRGLGEQWGRAGWAALNYGHYANPRFDSLPAWTPGAYEIANFARWVSDFSATSGGEATKWEKADHDTWRVAAVTCV